MLPKLVPGASSAYRKSAWLAFATTAVELKSGWDYGPTMEASYDQGTTGNEPPNNIFSLFVYKFFRSGPEPERVEEYEPDYREMPEEPAKPDPHGADHLDGGHGEEGRFPRSRRAAGNRFRYRLHPD